MTEHPNPAAQAQTKGWGCGKALLFVVGLLVLAVALIDERPDPKPPTPAQREQRAERESERRQALAESTAQTEARVLCRYAVEARLRAPSTAEWEKVPRVERLAAGRYEVSGWVDAENAFGGTLRNDYRCVVAGRRVEAVEIRAR